MSDFLKGYLASEAASIDIIVVKKAYIQMNDGNLHDALLFSQIMYWHGNSLETGQPRMKIVKNGNLWVAKSYADWHKETCIKERTIRKSLNRIKDRNLIFTKLCKFNNTPVLHIRINPDEFQKRMIDALKQLGIDFDSTQYVKSDLTQYVKSITDTTSDTTKDNNIKDIISAANALPTTEDSLNQQKEVSVKKKRKPNPIYDTVAELQKIEPTIQTGFGCKVVKQLFEQGYTSEQIIECGKDIQQREWWIQNNIQLTPSQIKKHIAEFTKSGTIDETGNRVETLSDGTTLITLKSEMIHDSNVVTY